MNFISWLHSPSLPSALLINRSGKLKVIGRSVIEINKVKRRSFKHCLLFVYLSVGGMLSDILTVPIRLRETFKCRSYDYFGVCDNLWISRQLTKQSVSRSIFLRDGAVPRHPFLQQVPRSFSSGMKHPGHVTDHTSAEFKMACTPPFPVMTWRLTKHTDKVSSYLHSWNMM
jgi:hypothetical protein